MTSQLQGEDYKPSPYSSILPRVRLSKSKPILVQVLDVPPLPANSNRTSSTAVLDEISCRYGEDGDAYVHQVDTVSTTSAGSRGGNSTFILVHGATDSQKEQQVNICFACSKHAARYKCPKCSAPYCSVQCYRIHDGTDLNSENNLHLSEKKLCTESFFKNRVLGEYHAREDDEDQKNLRGILNRMHQDINEEMENAARIENSLSQLLKQSETTLVSGLNGYDSRYSAAAIYGANDQISDEELAELASYILNLEDNIQEENEEASMERLQQLKDSLPSHLLPAFEWALASAIASGQEIGQDCELHLNDDYEQQQIHAAWKPWWLPDLECAMDKNDMTSGEPTLDDRILAIPPLLTLISQTNNRNLAYNILDVLFATSFAMRSVSSSLHNAHASNNAADLLLSQSLVLSSDSMYESVYEAMASCAEHFVQMNKTHRIGDGAALSWNTVATDVALISCNRRYVLRLLFEAADLFGFGVDFMRNYVKLIQKRGNKDEETCKQKKKAIDEIKRQYKLVLKKIEYFQSWCSYMWSVDLSRDISHEVDAFVKHWKMPEREVKESQIESLLGSMLDKKRYIGMKYDSAFGLSPFPIDDD
ncbi:hypothetical protein ACHAW6_008218 [Cyclotella cf. meneghiniana]